MFLQLLLKNKTFFIAGGFFAVLAILFVIVMLLSLFSSEAPEIPKGDDVSPLTQTVVERTTQREVESLPTVENKEVLPDGSVRYTLKSPLITRKNEVIVKNNVVVFERILVPEKRGAEGYATISEFREKFGEPEEVVRGSKYYGFMISTLIYAEQGFSLIANTITDEVYEIQRFQPMSVASYREQYGEDIDEDSGPHL